jgi:MFS family permease
MPGGAERAGVASWRFVWYTASQGISIIGTMMSYTALYWLTLHIAHGNAAVLSTIVAAQFLPMLLFSRKAAAIVARHRPVHVVIVTQSAQAIGSLALAIPLLVGWMSVWYLAALAFAVGCAQVVDVPGRQMFMMSLVGEVELRRGSSLYAAITGLAKIAGPGLAGVIMALTNYADVFLVDALSYLIVIGVLVRLSKEIIFERPAGSDSEKVHGRFRWILRLPRDIQIAAGMALLVGGFGIQFEVTNPLMATAVFHLSPIGFGLLGTLMAAGGIAGNFYSSRRQDPHYLEFVAWAMLFGLAEVIAAVMPVAWAYAILMVAIGATIQLFAVSAIVYVQKNTPVTQRAQGLSAYNAGFMGFVPAGSFVVAGIAAHLGIRWALACPGMLIVVAAVALVVHGRRPKRGPEVADDYSQAGLPVSTADQSDRSAPVAGHS